MRRYHDVGGQPGDPLTFTSHDFKPWEKLVTGLLSSLRARGIGNLDQMRRLVEDLPPEVYDRGYVECRAESVRGIIEEHGAITHAEIDQRMAAIEKRLRGMEKSPSTKEKNHDHGHHHDHDHHHDHNEHGHPILTYADDSVHDQDDTSYYALLAEAMRELAIEKGLIKATDIREHLEIQEGEDPELGPKVVARAWTDPKFKKRLLENGRQAILDEFGIDPSFADLIVLENDAAVHNLVVCTLCSCYPRNLLGQPPDWYKSKSYRARAVKEPRDVLRDFGLEVPAKTTIRVHDSNADMRYLVLPQRPKGSEGMSEADLAKLVTRDAMVGASLPKVG